MASPRTSEREEERRFNLRTLAIASAASATAAVVTSQLWIAGTWIAAAMTPVLVTLISELLHRPTERIAERVTADRPALRRRRAGVPESAEPPPPAEPSKTAEPPEPAETPETIELAPSKAPDEAGAGPVRVYRSSAPAPRRRKIAVGAVLGTSALALLIAVVALTVPELVAGGAIGKSDKRSTFFPRDREPKATDDEEKKKQQQAPSETTDRQQTTETTTTEPPADEEITTDTTTTPTPPAEEETTTTETGTEQTAPAPEEQP